jgi:hypothetical protein
VHLIRNATRKPSNLEKASMLKVDSINNQSTNQNFEKLRGIIKSKGFSSEGSKSSLNVDDFDFKFVKKAEVFKQ